VGLACRDGRNRWPVRQTWTSGGIDSPNTEWLGSRKDAPRSGRPRTISLARTDEIVRLTTQSTPRRRHSLEHPHLGPSGRGEPLDHRADLAGARSKNRNRVRVFKLSNEIAALPKNWPIMASVSESSGLGRW